MKIEPLLEHWYAALASPIGIVLETSDPEAAKQRLYRIRVAAKDPALDAISIVASPLSPDTDIWLVRKTPDVET